MMDIDVGDNILQDAVEDGGSVNPSMDELQPFQTVTRLDESSSEIIDDLYDDSVSCFGMQWQTSVYENAGIETYLKHSNSRATFE
jgi:hypothetical protein